MTDRRIPSRLTLEDLLAPTPSGVQKLLAAWDGLSVETQIEILNAFRSKKLPRYLSRSIAARAFQSDNAYVRYLAYRGEYLDRKVPEDLALLRAIREDQSALVRSVVRETDYSSFEPDFQPLRFWALPHEDRLARVRELRGSGEEIAALVKYGLDSTATASPIPVLEVWEVLADYLGSSQFNNVYAPEATDLIRDGMTAYYRSKDLKALWLLIPESPLQMALLLVSELPAKGGMFCQIPDEVLDNLSDGLLSTLLYREDIELEELRKAIYFDLSKSDMVVSAALSSHFSLSNEEFLAVEDFKKAGQVEKVKQLVMSGRGLTMVQYDALGEMTKELGQEHSLWSEWIYENRKAACPALVGSSRIAETMLELQLFEVAKSLMQGEAPTGELKIFAPCRSEAGLWVTFLNLQQVYRAERNKTAIKKALPKVWNEWDSEERSEAIEDVPVQPVTVEVSPIQPVTGYESALDLSSLLSEVGHLSREAKQMKSILYVLVAILCVLVFKML